MTEVKKIEKVMNCTLKRKSLFANGRYEFLSKGIYQNVAGEWMILINCEATTYKDSRLWIATTGMQSYSLDSVTFEKEL